MNRNTKMILAAALISGLATGSAALANDHEKPKAGAGAEKASCNGKEGCGAKDKTSCKGKDKKNDKNHCKGADHCAAKEEAK